MTVAAGRRATGGGDPLTVVDVVHEPVELVAGVVRGSGRRAVRSQRSSGPRTSACSNSPSLCMAPLTVAAIVRASSSSHRCRRRRRFAIGLSIGRAHGASAPRRAACSNL